MSALSRFTQMGMIEETAYLTKKGNSTVFLRCPSESGPKLQELVTRLTKDRGFSAQYQNKIFSEIDEVIMRTQGPVPLPMPRL